MDEETALKIFGWGFIPFLAWCVHVTWTLRQISKDMRQQLVMQVASNETTKENTDALKELTHYLCDWLERLDGERPKPPKPV